MIFTKQTEKSVFELLVHKRESIRQCNHGRWPVLVSITIDIDRPTKHVQLKSRFVYGLLVKVSPRRGEHGNDY